MFTAVGMSERGFIILNIYYAYMADQRPKGSVKSARTTFRILEELKERTEATLTDIAEEFDLSRSSIHNYLSTLESEGYVIKDGNTYRIGLRFLEFGGHARHNEHLYHIAREEVTDLAKETGEMSNLLIEEQGKGVYLFRARGERAVQTDTYIGERVYLHNTALGKSILAYLPRQRVEEIIERHGLPAATERTITDRDELYEELERVREDGVAFDDEARFEGQRCVGVPIINDDDEVEGAISLSGPVSRFQGERFRWEIPNKLKDAAHVIQFKMTYTRDT
jgi:DNA-binding IclR family transcriptional regulator